MPGREPTRGMLRSPLQVLVVEDEERYRAFLLDVLADMDCTAVGAATAIDALERIDEAPPDAVMLDLNLPVMDGMTFLERFRRRHRDTPVIILTGVGDLSAAQRAIRHGVTDFLTKPCHLGQIEAALDRARRACAARPDVAPDDGAADAPPADGRPADAPRSIADLEREAIVEALGRHRGNRTAAAHDLGISRRTLYSRIERYRAEGVDLPVE